MNKQKIMRTIQFRAFDDGKMIYPTGALSKLKRFINVIREDAIIMQFTGLHDKNGKEIYEGDIFKLGVVEWIDGAFRFKNSSCYMVIDSHIAHNFEIIGNTSENPDLVKL